MLKNRESDGDKLMKKAGGLCKPSLMELRLKCDWTGAASMYEQAMTVYKLGKCWEKARAAGEKAAACQEQLGSSWHAGKMFEKAAEIAKEEKNASSVADLCARAAEAFLEAGRPQQGSAVLHKGAMAVEEALPEKSSELYGRAIEVLELDDRFSIGPELFRSAVAHEIKRQRYEEAVGVLMQFAAVCVEKGLNMSICRSYLGAVTLWLYAENGQEASAIFRDSARIDAFRGSDEYKSAAALLDAYQAADVDAIKAVVRDRVAFQFLDTAVGRLAMKLPTGDVERIAKNLQSDAEEADEDLT